MSRPRVYKVGGPALEADLLPELAREVGSSDVPVLLVHGGGRQVDDMMRTLGIESHFVNGRRATSADGMRVVEMMLSGTLNKSLASGLTSRGVKAVGISGRDGNLLRAAPVPELGRVGRPETVDPGLVEALWRASLVPVVSPVSAGPDGESLNVNADEAALALARALGASQLVYLSDVDGVRVAGRTLDALSAAEAEGFVADGTITGGMALKVGVALEAQRAGITDVYIAGKARLLGRFPGTRVTGVT